MEIISQSELDMLVSLFVRLWVEMFDKSSFSESIFVSLFVRLWVEISCRSGSNPFCSRQPLREAVSWNFPIIEKHKLPCIVSLFVRLWVEILSFFHSLSCSSCQPLREAVSWNNATIGVIDAATASASSWGCELKYCYSAFRSWLVVSASSWGCELKYTCIYTHIRL